MKIVAREYSRGAKKPPETSGGFYFSVFFAKFEFALTEAAYSQHMKPHINAQVNMETEANGGRHREFLVGYAPHLVVPPSSVFLGVRVLEIEGDNRCKAVYQGTSAQVIFQLLYYPDIDYSDLVEGAEFNIHEGPHIVGTGRVL